MPLIDEHVRAVGREVRDLARLHGELARVEALVGVRRLVMALCLLAFGVTMAVLVIIAFSIALFAWIRSWLSAPYAAFLVGLAFAVVMAGSWLLSWRLARGAKALLLPRTRAMLWELLQWREAPTTSSETSAPDAGK